MPEIKLENVSKYFFDTKKNIAYTGIYQLSLIIPNHSFTVITGPSGSGKTTLLKVIAGLLEIDEGKLFFDGIDYTYLATNKRNLSLLTQNDTLYPKMTCFEIIAYPLLIAKVPIEEIKKRVYEIAELLNITLFLSRYPKVLSGGQKQLVALAKALIKEPSLILLDEPFANIDEEKRNTLRVILKNIYEKLKINIILVTHNQYDTAYLGTFKIELDNSELKK
ncbi:MAG: ABC transporter ATP-binding protein [Bacillales bacterium]|jgi:ABC-type sugar transport system ATPase subunit|nr:ABC transporter ATP-binding protein [Bacillales bacterium]